LEQIVQIRREFNEAIQQAYQDYPELSVSLGPLEEVLIEERPQRLLDFCNKNARSEAEQRLMDEADAETLGLVIPERPS
jgi:hypothetical protein